MQIDSVARPSVSKPLPAIPKKPLPKPPASSTSSSSRPDLQDPVSDKIAEELAFAFHQTAEFVKRYATNLQLIQAQPQDTITNGFFKTIRISEKAMQECIVPLVVSRPEINMFDCTWIVVEPNSLVSLINASAKHSLRQVLITRVMTLGEKIALRKNVQYLKARCQPKEASSAFVKYVINPNFNTQTAFKTTLLELILKHNRQPSMTKLWIIERDERAVFIPQKTERAAIHVSGVETSNFVPQISLALRTCYHMTLKVRDSFKEVEQRGAARALPDATSAIDRVRFSSEDAFVNYLCSQQKKGPYMPINDALMFVILHAQYTDQRYDMRLEDDAKSKAKSYLKKLKNDPTKGPLRDLGKGCILDRPCCDKLLRPLYASYPRCITLSLAPFLGGVEFDSLQEFLKEKIAITRLVIDPKQFDESEQAKLRQVIKSLGRNIDIGEIEYLRQNPFENKAKEGSKKRDVHVEDQLYFLIKHCYLPDGPTDHKQSEEYASKARSKARSYLEKVKNKSYEGPWKDHGKGGFLDKECIQAVLNKVYDENPQFFVFSIAGFTGGVDLAALGDCLKAKRQISRVIYAKDQFDAIELVKLKKLIADNCSERRILVLKEMDYFYSENPFKKT